MNLIVITVFIQNFILITHSQMFFFDFIPDMSDDEEKTDDEFSFYEEVLIDPHYEYRFCSNDFELEKTLQENAWSYIVEKVSEVISIEELSEYEFVMLRTLMENFLEPVASYISEVEENYFRFKFFDINVCNNVTDEELEKIIASYYYKNVIINELDSHS